MTSKLSWQPAPDAARKILAWFAAGGGAIGVVGFAVSFASVMNAAYPYLGWACWTLPVLVDLAIFTLSGLALFLELHEIRSRVIRAIPNALAAFTVYLNTATQPGVFGKAVHAAGPLIWVTVVEIATFTVRRLVDLSSESSMDRVRGSRWLLAPLSTARLRRRMILDEQTSYRAAVDGAQARTVSKALLRQWYGLAWRGKAPRAERLAVKLQGVTAQPVTELLTRASTGITSAAAAAVKPAARETAETAPQPPADSALMPLDPIVYRLGERPVLPSFAPFTAQQRPFAASVKALPTGPVPGARENEAANAANATENERDTAIRMRREGASFQQIAGALGRSKSWAYDAAGDVPIEHANGSSAA